MARQILTEPIIVQNDSYFKLSFTYKVKNPHENREVNRIREIRYGGIAPSVSVNLGSYYPYYQERFSNLPKDKKVIIFTQSSNSYSNQQAFEDYVKLELGGWKKIIEPIVIPLENKRYVEINFLEPDLAVSDNFIQNPLDYQSNNAILSLYYCSNNVESLSLSSSVKIAKEELVNSLEFSITPNLDKENRIYLILREYFHNYMSCSQLDEDRCDFFFSYNQNQNLFLDTTNALTHTFKSNFNDYNLWCLVLEPTMKTNADGNEIPLYHDEPVK